MNRGSRAPRVALALLILVASVRAAAAEPRASRPGSGDSEFQRLANGFIEHLLDTRPQLATRLGVHDRDSRLVPVTETTLADDDAWYQDLRTRLGAIPRASLSFDRALEYDLLLARTNRELLDLEVLRPYATNPNAYLDLVAGSIQSLLDRDYASLCSRLRSCTKRLRQVPEVLRAARINLRAPSRIATQVAIGQFTGALALYREQIPAASLKCKDAAEAADLAEADSLAVRAVADFIDYLRDDLLPRTDTTFAIGRDAYQRRLEYDEMVTTPTDTLLAWGLTRIESTRARMQTLAERIAPGRGVSATLDSLRREHPRAERLVPYVAAGLDSIRAFLRTRKLVTMPGRENLRVRETPVFRRGLSFASMESPGVWEHGSTIAYFNVTPVDPSWSEQQQQDHLGFFNRYGARIVTIHEALPGHYYQFLALRRVPSRLRQILGSATNTEGWAHYCEQMAIEEGFGSGDPRYELAQQEQALQRLGRLVVSISMHTRGMSYDEAVKVFEDRCWMTPVNAAREARRGALDPTYLAYTLGKWQILRMREEIRQRLGPRFKLRDFHDAFLRQGNSALPVVRAALLEEIARGRWLGN